MKRTDRQASINFSEFLDNFLSGSPIDLTETPTEKKQRIKELENDFEKWAEYYFSKFYTSKPALFHIKASKRIINNPEWFEVRSWSRDLAKSTRALMEVLFLTLTGKKKNVLLVSFNLDNAVELLRPFKRALEINERIINDYGVQQSLSKWTEKFFKTKKGVQFKALGKGQNPRGTRNENVRPDLIIMDDIDDDEEILNPDRVKETINWVRRALFGTRSTSSENSLLVLAIGNIIGDYTVITELSKKADYHDIINIIDSKGNITWPEKINYETIERIKSMISINDFNSEYMNNPIKEGDIFKKITYDKCPKLNSCDSVVIYADPATSNRNSKGGSMKAVGIIGKKKQQFYLYKVWLDNMSNDKFIDCLFRANEILEKEKVNVFKVYIENNSLQNPFYEQVLLPTIREKSIKQNTHLPITPDTRRKGDKFTRIEATLEPLNRLGQLIFNIKEKENPDMQNMENQMLSVSEKCKIMDGPDMLEGGIWILKRRNINNNTTYKVIGKARNMKY